MAYDAESLIATAIERLNENMIRMDERWNEAMKEMRSDFKQYQQATDSKMDKTNDLLSKLVYIDTEMKEANKRVHHRIDEVVARVKVVEDNQHIEGCPVHKTFVAKRNEQVERFKEIAENLDDRLKTIETKGAKRWEVVVTEIIKYTVVLIIGAVLFKFGLKP